MGFWSFLGLANKKDIENINKQVVEIKNLIGVSISVSDNISTICNKTKKDIAVGINEVRNDFDELNCQHNKNYENLKTHILGNQTALSSILDRVYSEISMLNKKTEVYEVSLNELQKSISELNNRTSRMESILNDKKVINQLVEEVKENKKQLDTLNKDVGIVQQMIRVVWVNDLIDTLEDKSGTVIKKVK